MGNETFYWDDLSKFAQPKLTENTKEILNRSFSCYSLHSVYPASSWFLLRQTREKLLLTTDCFSIEQARVLHTARDAFETGQAFLRHEWINKFIIANLISVIILIICSSDK